MPAYIRIQRKQLLKQKNITIYKTYIQIK